MRGFTDAPDLRRPPRVRTALSGPRTLRAHERKSLCVKGGRCLVRRLSLQSGDGVGPQQRVIGLPRRRAGLPMMCVEITECLNAAEDSPGVQSGVIGPPGRTLGY
jgi:hypothetical protein